MPDSVNDISAGCGSESGETDVGDLIHEALHLIMPMADRRKVSLGITGRVEGASLMMSERLLRRIIWNVLSNAVRFTGAGGIVRVSVDHRPSGELAILVHDTGVGMTPEEITLALSATEPVTSRVTAEQPEQGTGLGLPRVKAMMELHHGALHIDSVPNDGTIIVLLFPARLVIDGRGTERISA